MARKAYLKLFGVAAVCQVLCQEGPEGPDDRVEGRQRAIHEHAALQQGQTHSQAGQSAEAGDKGGTPIWSLSASRWETSTPGEKVTQAIPLRSQVRALSSPRRHLGTAASFPPREEGCGRHCQLVRTAPFTSQGNSETKQVCLKKNLEFLDINPNGHGKH